MTTESRTKRLLGPLSISSSDRREPRFFAVVRRRGWSFYVGDVRTASIAPRYERWAIRARTRGEAVDVLQYHFYNSTWRLLPNHVALPPTPPGAEPRNRNREQNNPNDAGNG